LFRANDTENRMREDRHHSFRFVDGSEFEHVDGLDLASLLANWHCGYSSMMSSTPPALEELIEFLEAHGLYELAELLQSVWPHD